MRKMHERNIYKTPPDFVKLAEEYETFGKHVTISSDGKGHLNFKDAEAVRELTYTLLRHDFGLHLEIPFDRLIPTVPLRLNYILWIEDLINECSTESKTIKGIDIGCGASCIYPLLGAKLNHWNFIASESDTLSQTFAAKNIEMNNLSSNITLKKGNPDTLLKNIIEDDTQYDFCMCNPPFFNEREEASGIKSRTDKRSLPHSVCTATDDESITEGGEVAFVRKIIEESMKLKHSVRWYTSMLGKKASLKALNRYITEQKIPFVTHTVFQQGKTTRWGICWSFHKKAKQQAKLSPVPKPNPLPFMFVVSKSEMEQRYTEQKYNLLNELAKVKLISSDLQSLLSGLEVSCTESSMFNDAGDIDHICAGEAWKNSWSHQRQKRRMEKKLKMLENDSDDSKTTIASTSLESELHVLNGIGNGTSNEAMIKTSVPNATEVGDNIMNEEKTENTAESQLEQIIGYKRARPQSGKKDDDSSQRPIFKFRIKTSVNRESENMDAEPVKVEVFCLEGNRESLHQLFMYLRNQLNGIQKHTKKK